jgi:hypothetical protein
LIYAAAIWYGALLALVWIRGQTGNRKTLFKYSDEQRNLNEFLGILPFIPLTEPTKSFYLLTFMIQIGDVDSFDRCWNAIANQNIRKAVYDKCQYHNEEHLIPAKLCLQKEDDGSVSVKVHSIQRLSIRDEHMGHTFSKQEKAALLNDKNLGQTIELTNKKGVRESYYLSIDPKTNELVPLKAKQIQAPDKIKGVNLSSEQKEKLAAGHKVSVIERTGKNERKFSATLQVDAATRKIGFSDFKQDIYETAKQVNKEEKKAGTRQKVT